MTADEVLAMAEIYQDAIIAQLADGAIGIVTGYPFYLREECLVSVHGEPTDRRIHPRRLSKLSSHVLAELPPAPDIPVVPELNEFWKNR